MKKIYVAPHLSWDVFRCPMCLDFENRVRCITEQLRGMLKDKFYFEIPQNVPLLDIYDYLRNKQFEEFVNGCFK